MASLDIKVFRGKEGFYQIKHEWDSLVDSLEQKSLFHSYQWHKSHIDTLDNNDCNIAFLLMYRDDRLFAIFPFEEREIKFFAFTFRIIEVPHCNSINIVDFILTKQPDHDNLLDLFFNSLKQQYGIVWNFMYFPNVLESSSLFSSLNDISFRQVIMDKVGESQYFQSGTYDEIRKNISKQFRQQLNLKRNRLSRLGDVRYVSVKGKEELKKAFHKFLELEASGWKGQRGTAIKNNIKDKQFYTNLTENFSLRGCCEINWLTLNSEIIAGSYWLIHDDAVYFLKIGYDTTYSRVSPGLLLLDNDIRRYVDDQALETVSLVSDYQWQARWKPLSQDVFSIIICNTSSISVITFNIIKFMIKVYRGGVKPALSMFATYVKHKKANKRVFLKK